tara:strand:+ start:4053 stop:4337 length:285 start_codon:yes stop_codon:yes gene_type:complete
LYLKKNKKWHKFGLYLCTDENLFRRLCLFKNKNQRKMRMLKEYAVALVLSTAAPVAADKQEGADKAPEQKKETVSQPQQYRPKSGNGVGWPYAI